MFLLHKSLFVFAQISAKIDERLELTTVVLRLTGQNAFTRAPESNYTVDVDSCFSKFKDHELINFVKRTIHSRKVLNLPLPVELDAFSGMLTVPIEHSHCLRITTTFTGSTNSIMSYLYKYH